MKALIVSDVHSNWHALSAIKENADRTFFVGDAVNYGPSPEPCVQWLHVRASLAVSGNHDYAISHDADPRCSAPYREAAEAMGRDNRAKLSTGCMDLLRGLPLTAETTFGGVRFYAVHSAPSDPLFGYYPPEVLEEQIGSIEADVILVGHTHLPFVRRVGEKWLVNPGSVGQPKDGDPRASYAVWEDGQIELRRVAYDIEATCRELATAAAPRNVVEMLQHVLRTGGDAN